MLTAAHPEEPTVRVLPPEEALRTARPLPLRDEFVMKDISREDWAKFREALREA